MKQVLIRRRWLVDLTLVVVGFGIPLLARAQADSPFQQGATSALTQFKTIAAPIATIAVMALGVAAVMGRIAWGWVVGAVLGIVIVFGADTLITWIRGLFGVPG